MTSSESIIVITYRSTEGQESTSISVNDRYVVFGNNNQLHIYELSESSRPLHTLSDSTSSGGNLGFSVSLYNNKIITSSPNEYKIYECDINSESVSLSIITTSFDNLTGFSVSRYGENYVASSPLVDQGRERENEKNFGYIVNNSGSISNTNQIIHRDGTSRRFFINYGYCLSLYDNYVLTTNYQENGTNFNHRTFVRLLNVSDLSEVTKFEIGDLEESLEGNRFIQFRHDHGFSCSLSENYAVVGSKDGKIWIYQKQVGDWSSWINLSTHSGVSSTDESFGRSVSISGKYLAVRDSSNVYVYDLDAYATSTSPRNLVSIDTKAYTDTPISVSIYAHSNTYNLAVKTNNNVYLYYSEVLEPEPESEAEVIGDPYIKPMYGSLYKLPDVETCYRILESKNIYINAQVQRIEQDYINTRARELNSEYFKDVHAAIYNWDSMYFFTKICIHYSEEIAVFDLLKGNLVCDCPSWLTLKDIAQDTICSSMYINEHVLKVVELSINNMLTIQAALYLNPQVLTGIKVKKCLDKLDGLLIHKYSSDSACVSSLYDTSKCTFKHPARETITEETFFTNNGTSVIKRIPIV